MKKNKLLLSLLLFAVIFLSACGKQKEPESPITEETVLVTAQRVADSRGLDAGSSYPAIVSAGMESRLSAQVSGLVADANFQVGDMVSAGQVLAQINEVGANNAISNRASSNQIKQAIIAAQQAQESYQLARSNYENIVVSSARDLEQANIARKQASSSLSNFGATSVESIKSAQLAFETAQLATRQSQLSLLNREKQLTQTSYNLQDNARLAASSAFTTVGSVLTGINNITGFDDNNVVNIDYRNNLGALDSSSYLKADTAYQIAQVAYKDYGKREKSDVESDLEIAISMLNKAKSLTDSVKYLFDKSIPSASLPQSSAGGVSLSSLQNTAASYQSQLNGALSQAQGTLQALRSFTLENESTMDSLRQAYALAQKQEASAAQNLSSMKVGNKSQNDQASFSVSLADNQYENLKVKLNSQVIAAKTQMDSAQLQYNNASLSLQALYDVRSIVSPIDGKVFQKLFSNGDTVSPGQLVVVVGQSDGIKLKFFIEADKVELIKLDQEIRAVDSDGKEYVGKVSSISAQAEPVSKRFQVEATLVDLDNPPLLGTVVNVNLEFSQMTNDSKTIYLPLSALEIGQNGNYVYIIEDGRAKKVPVELKTVLGESAELVLDVSPDVFVITDGNKFLSEGDLVSVKQ